MPNDAPPKSKPAKHFTPFHSAAEEAATRVERESWDNEGGQLSSHGGRIVYTAGDLLPYKVVLSHEGSRETARGFPSKGEAESFIRRNTPPADRDASEL